MEFLKTIMTILAILVAMSSASAATMLIQKDSGYSSGTATVHLSGTGFSKGQVHTSHSYGDYAYSQKISTQTRSSFGHAHQVVATVEGDGCCPITTVNELYFGAKKAQQVHTNAAFGAYLPSCYQ